MLATCALARSSSTTTGGLAADRSYIASQLTRLLNKGYWELCSPSRALSVLDLLRRCGTRVSGLEHVAFQPIANFAACLTNEERCMLSNLTTRLPFGGTGESRDIYHHEQYGQREAEMIMNLYAAACKQHTNSVAIAHVLRKPFVQALDLTSSLLLLELLVSRHLDVDVGADFDCEILLAHICDRLDVEPVKVNFKCIAWLLMVLTGDSKLFRFTVSPAQGAPLFRACVRHLHRQLPVLDIEQCAVAYLYICCLAAYEQPFVLIRMLDRRLLTAPLVDLAALPIRLIVQLFTSPFTKEHPRQGVALLVKCYKTGQLRDLTMGEGVVVLVMLSRWHLTLLDTMLQAVSSREWDELHSCLFASLFVFITRWTMREAVMILEHAEIIHISALHVAVPYAFSERVKRRVFDLAKLFVKTRPHDKAASVAEGDAVLENLLRLSALLHRCTILPYTTSDAITVRNLLCDVRSIILHRPGNVTHDCTSDE